MLFILLVSCFAAYIPLNSMSNIVYMCDYSKPIKQIAPDVSGLSCSSMYTPVLASAGFQNNFTA